MAEVTSQEKLFAREYLSNGRNATQAVITLGYAPKSARVQGSRMLHRANVQAIVNNADSRAVDKAAVTVERVVAEAAKLAFLNPQDFYDKDGNLLAVTDMPEDAARALAGMEVEQLFERDDDGKMQKAGVLRKIKFAAKLPALDLLAKHLGAYPQHDNSAGMQAFQINIHLNSDNSVEVE